MSVLRFNSCIWKLNYNFNIRYDSTLCRLCDGTGVGGDASKQMSGFKTYSANAGDPFSTYQPPLVSESLGVPRRHPHRRSGLATLPSVVAVP